MRHLSREEYDKITTEFAQLKSLSAQKNYIEKNKLGVEICEPDKEKEEGKEIVKEEENTDGLRQDSK